ncbi:hypothetical protein D9M68_954000 [compost metagenome]
MDRVALDAGDAVDADDLRAGNAELVQRLCIAGEALGIGEDHRRGNQALASEQLEEVAVCQA